jgi:hypothetical protein
MTTTPVGSLDEPFQFHPEIWEGRHPSVRHFLPLFAFEHLPAGPLRDCSEAFAGMAEVSVESIPDDPELAAGLRKLLEAKDCMVRATLLGMQARADG